MTNGAEYPELYNWSAVSNLRNINPTGWHLPDFYEMWDLGDLIGTVNSGGRLKEAGTGHLLSPNEYGFSALSGGYRDPYSGIFYKSEKWCGT